MDNKNIQELKQPVDETTDQQAPTGETNEDTTSSEDESSAEGNEEGAFDYNAELERLQEENENFKKGLYAAKDKLKKIAREQKEQEAEQQYDDTDDTSTLELMKKEALQAAREEIASFKREIVLESIDSSIDKLTNNKAEHDLIKYHYENTINHSGYSKESIMQDLGRARLLANEKRLLREKDELVQSLKAKGSLSDSAIGPSQKHQETDMPKLSPEDLALLKRRGIDPKKVKFD